jgi:hypothetical protein
MEGIKARIKLKHIQGAELAYIYEKDLLNQIGLKPTEYDPSETFMNIDDVILLNDKRYKIVGINTKFLNEIEDMEDLGGINMYGIGEQLPYNFQITYLLEDNF